MLNFFTEPYNEEILYSTLARYHYYRANTNYRDTIMQTTGRGTALPTIAFPCGLEYLAKHIKYDYSSDYFINKHTLMPFYFPFLPVDRREKVIKDMKHSIGSGIYAKTGMSAGSICSKTGLFYCPVCAGIDYKIYGEAYFHRVHQIQGVMVCPEHACNLYEYPIRQNDKSRIEFIRFEYNLINTSIKFEKDKSLRDRLFQIANAAFFLLNNDLSNYTQQSVHEKYLNLLRSRGMVTLNGRIDQVELYNQFNDFYGNDLLYMLQSDLDNDIESNWLKVALRKQKRTIHPIRHILLILFLSDSIESFFLEDVCPQVPFGKGPWVCLNPVADHYKKHVVEECVITSDYKTREPVGTFICKCGFIYSRKGPDKSEDDKFKVGRIKAFGQVWEDKLKQVVLDGNNSLRGIAKQMGCDVKTVIKYSEKIGVRYLLKSNIDTRNVKKVGENYCEQEDLFSKYKVDISEFIKNNGGCNRTQVREKLAKQYTFLYRHDKDWLFKMLPKSICVSRRNSHTKSRIDWGKRDDEIREEVRNVYNELIMLEAPVRITRSLISKKIGRYALLNKYIDKLPKTKRLMDILVESVEDFQVRRIEDACESLYMEKGELKKWEVIRKAGLRTEYAYKLNPIIEREMKDTINNERVKDPVFG